MAVRIAASVLVVLVLNAILVNGVLVVPNILNQNGPIPFAVSLQTTRARANSPFHHFCGGSIIGEQWIITAANCFNKNLNQGKLTAVVGTNNYNKGGEQYQIESIAIHPFFNHTQSRNKYDIALVKTTEPIKLNDKVSLIPMSKESIDSFGTEVYATSWIPTKLRKTPLKISTKKLFTVSNGYGVEVLNLKYGQSIHDSLICAVPENRVNNNPTVAGSGLIANNMLVGVFSWASSALHVAGKPEIFTSFTSHYIDSWIQKTTSIELY